MELPSERTFLLERLDGVDVNCLTWMRREKRLSIDKRRLLLAFVGFVSEVGFFVVG